MHSFSHIAKSLMAGRRNVLLIAAAGILTVTPSIFNGIPRGNDLPQHYRSAISFYESLAKGDLYPGWNSRSGQGYGDVGLRFYPPLLFYLLSACRALAGNWYDASLMLFVLLTVTGGLGVYYCARTFLSNDHAMFAGLLYLIAPYHVNQFYQASLFAEYTASSILPFTFAFTELVCRRGQARDIFGLAISYGLLVLAHLPLTVIGSISLLVYALLRTGAGGIRQAAPKLALAVLLALCASAAYWTTMIAELPWIRGEKLDPNPWFDYRYNFIFWKTVEGSTNWWVNILAVASVMMFLPALALKRLWKGRIRENPVKALGLLTAGTFIMTLPISEPIWKLLVPLQRIEFPWRWLALFSIAGCVLVAASIQRWMSLARGGSRKLVLLASASVILPLALTVSQTIRGATYIARTQFERFAANVTESNTVPFWLPVWATNDTTATSHKEVEAGSRPLSIESWQPALRSFRVGSGEAAEARVRTFYYPYWIAMTGNRRLAVRADTDGAILIPLSEAAQLVTLEFQDPARRRWLTWLSLIVWVSLVSGILFLSLSARNRARSMHAKLEPLYDDASM